MKIGTRLLTVAGLLLTLPCLAAPQNKAVKAHRHPHPADVTPTFDHDPMSITVGTETTIQPTIYKNQHGTGA